MRTVPLCHPVTVQKDLAFEVKKKKKKTAQSNQMSNIPEYLRGIWRGTPSMALEPPTQEARKIKVL